MANDSTPKGYETLNKISLIAGILGVAATAYFSLAASSANSRLEALEAENLELQKTRASFNTSVFEGSLVLSNTGSVFSAPDILTITPIFSNDGGPPITGGEVTLGLNSARIDASIGSIKFERISERICKYKDNKDLCERSDLKLETLVVSFTVDGIKDSDPVHIY